MRERSQLRWDLSRAVREVNIPAFTVVCEQGTHGDCMYWVKEGNLDVIVGGKKVATLEAGDSFGQVALLSQQRLRTSSVRASTGCTLLVLDGRRSNNI